MAALSHSEAVSRKMLASLSEIGQKLASVLELQPLLSQILDLAIDNTGAERGVVFLKHEATGEFAPESARGLGRLDLDDLSRFSRSVVRQSAEGRTILTVDVGQDPALQQIQSITVNEIKSILCLPMRARGSVIGVLYLDTQKRQRLFTEKDRAFVESFANQAAVAIENARIFGTMRAENGRLRQEVTGRFRDLVGTSAAMGRLRDLLGSVSGSESTILLTGESGTGKGVVERAIHLNGPRAAGRFVPVDCGALPETLLEAELFGCRRGAFTGADRDRVGLIEAANGGTLFLDEITNTTVALQVRLLRVLQEREVRRLGENDTRKVDVRVIAATNAPIERLIADGTFREDLYYRLNVVRVEVPPLRERREDIALLAEHFLELGLEAGNEPGLRPGIKRFGPGVLGALTRRDWPGNVRELENMVERLRVLSAGPIITLSDLSRIADVSSEAASGSGNVRPFRRPDGGKTGEQLMIEDALKRCLGDKAKAARYIGWNRQKLYRRLKAYGIAPGFGKAA
ncbi:MAG TPA: sigma-54-dependent Fis family transcriptional regulator [Candidatus Polarisedimenticolia bacterium]|nr:sigma-54-dependent Fis family transcriptional regulator [Candidatus Polarisedimenticolia bacterium]